MDKTQLRLEFIQKRKRISLESVEVKSRLIEAHVQRLINWKDITSVHVYTAHTLLREVDTGWLAQFINDNWPHITLVFGEPSKNALPQEQPFDLIFVPLVAFDSSKHRLGFGGGWYDRFLAGQPKAIKIGLAYDLQQTNELPIEEHDIKLDFIVTESHII